MVESEVSVFTMPPCLPVCVFGLRSHVSGLRSQVSGLRSQVSTGLRSQVGPQVSGLTQPQKKNKKMSGQIRELNSVPRSIMLRICHYTTTVRSGSPHLRSRVSCLISPCGCCTKRVDSTPHCSRVVPHPSTKRAQTALTSVFG